jgi:fatty-acyl-CoA synthase
LPSEHPRAELPPDARQPLLGISIGARLREQAEKFAERPALVWVGTDGKSLKTLTYRELRGAAEAAARELALHAEPGDRIAVWAANSPEWVILECACAIAGAVLTPFNTAWTDDEMMHALTLTSPRALYAGPDNRGVELRDRAARLAGRIAGCSPLELASLRSAAGRGSAAARPVAPDDPFLIQFTSGTTGRAKGATLSHRAALNGGYIRARICGADETDVWVNPVPLHHIGGSCVILLAALSTGGCYAVMPRFEPRAMVELMRATGATRIGGVPTMLYALLDVPGIEAALAPVRTVGLGGTSVPPSLVERLQGYGATVSVAYAQSECPMITNSDPAMDAIGVATTVGVPAPHTELRIVADDGKIVARGAVGEVCVRSPLTMSGYYDMPDATRQVFDADGFLHTGDLGSIDAGGVVRIHGRAREVIIRGGENVYPIEVEDVLLRHPAVDAVAVLALPSERWGEEVAAVVRLSRAGAATAEQLTEHAARSLAHFKVPRHWRFVEALPTTASGKIRKVELPALFAS